MHYIEIDNTHGFYEAMRSDEFVYPLTVKTVGEVSESDKLKLFFSAASYQDREMEVVASAVYHGGCRIGVMRWTQPSGTEEQADISFSSLEAKKEHWHARQHSSPREIRIHSYRDYIWKEQPYEYGLAYFPTFDTLAGLMDYTRSHFSQKEKYNALSKKRV